ERMARHFDEIRSLETKLANLGGASTAGACALLPDPGEHDADTDIDQRAELLTDMLCMALTCDLTRVATMAWVYIHSGLNGKFIGSDDTDLHTIGHYYNIEQVDPV